MPLRSSKPMRRFLTLCICLLPALSQAHDLWIERAGTRLTLAYGHAGGGHAGERRLDYAPGSVQSALCVDADGAPVSTTFTGYPATLEADCAAAWFQMTNHWSKTPYGTKNLPKAEAGAVLDSWLAVESVKRIDAWGEALTRPLTASLELVPLRDPLHLKVGDKLRVAVYRDGRPLSGVTVAYFDQPRGVTEADGALNIRVRKPGLQLIQASIETPLDDGQADRRIDAAALQFEIAP